MEKYSCVYYAPTYLTDATKRSDTDLEGNEIFVILLKGLFLLPGRHSDSSF